MNFPQTPAIRFLEEHKCSFTPHLYEYEEHGGTAVSAAALNVDEHIVIKTLVMKNEKNAPLIILMHGDCKVSLKNLAREAGFKSIAPCTPEEAHKHTGYFVGGTSPFGTKKALPIFVEASILDLPTIYINGGKRGFLVSLSPEVLTKSLKAKAVSVALS